MNDQAMPAPQCAADAAEQLHTLQRELEQARTFARQYGTAADRAEHLYRRESAKAGVQIDAPNERTYKDLIHEWELPGPARADAAEVAGAMGLGDGQVVETVGELRWLRDRATRLADQWSATAYDRRNRVSAWMTVASMAKTEAELGGEAPERGPRAVAS